MRKKAQESWVVEMERKLKEPRQESDHNRQMLAKVESNIQPFPRGCCAPAVPPQPTEARRCQGIPWVIRHHPPQKEEDHSMRAQGPGVTCRFDSAHSSWVWALTTRMKHLHVFSLFRVILICIFLV